MTAREKVADVERQVLSMLQTGPVAFVCPFCGLTTEPGQNVLCCDNAADLIDSILDHLDFKRGCEVTNRILDGFEAHREAARKNPCLN